MLKLCCAKCMAWRATVCAGACDCFGVLGAMLALFVRSPVWVFCAWEMFARVKSLWTWIAKLLTREFDAYIGFLHLLFH